MGHRSAIALLCLSGCGFFGLDPADPKADTGEIAACEGEAICITALEPDWGPLEGGTQVAVRGAGFVDIEEVRFGSAPTAYTHVDDDTLLIVSPTSQSAGSVDVSVRAAGGDFTLYDAFTYSNEEPDPDPDDTDDPPVDDTGDPSTDPTGLVGALIESTFLGVGCPACFGLTSPFSYQVLSAFHEPVSGSWYSHLPAVGSCAMNPQPSSPVGAFRDVGEWLYLTAGASSINLHRSGGGAETLYSSPAMGQTDFTNNTRFDLSVPDGGGLGAFEVQGALLNTRGFTDLQPINILLDDPEAFSQAIYASSAQFTWQPTGVSESVIVNVGAYDYYSGQFVGEVMCRGTDSGYLTVPSTFLNSFPNYSLLAINVYRHHVEETVNPTNGSTIEGGSSQGLLGTGILVR